MDEQDLKNIRESIDRLTLRSHRLARALTASVAVLALGIVVLGMLGMRSRGDLPPGQVLKVRGIVVVDANGVERVRIQAPPP
jgi:hypothetical protein